MLADRFAVLDGDPGVPLFGAVSLEQQRRGLDSTRGYAALYAPWVRNIFSTSFTHTVLLPSACSSIV